MSEQEKNLTSQLVMAVLTNEQKMNEWMNEWINEWMNEWIGNKW